MGVGCELTPPKLCLIRFQYAELSKKLAVAELEPPPYEPLLANNSVTPANYEPSRTLNVPALLQAKEHFLSACVGLQIDLAELKRESANLLYVALILMMAELASRFRPDGVRRGYVSYRSHAEYFFANFDSTGKLREQMNAVDQRFRDQIDPNLKVLIDGDITELSLPAPLPDLLARWRQVVDETFPFTQAVVRDNHAAFIEGTDTTTMEDNFLSLADEITADLPERFRPDPEQVATGSVVGSALQHEEGRRLFRSAEFIAYRASVNFFYLLLPLLDVPPARKFMLCHLTANAVERVFSVDWRDWIPEAHARQHGAPV